MSVVRERRDRCPGALRPWPASDGLLVRLRLIGGYVSSGQLRSLVRVAEEFGDGHVHLTSRANLQVRAFPGTAAGGLDRDALRALEGTGLLPCRTHELVRNVMISPQTGLAGGHADVRPVGRELDRALCSNDKLAGLSGRFLFVLDDGRGDLLGRTCDLGLVLLDPTAGQLRVADGWGPVVAVEDAARALVGLADRFADVRENGPAAAWHIRELGPALADSALVATTAADPRLPQPAPPLPYGQVPGGRHVGVPGAILDRDAVAALTTGTDHVIVTPWRGVLVPGRAR